MVKKTKKTAKIKKTVKTKPKKSKEKPDNTNSVIITSVVVLLLILSILFLGIRFIKPNEDGKQILIEYNGFMFQEIEGLWHTVIQKQGEITVYEISLHYAPWELENLSVVGRPKLFFNAFEINDLNAAYVTFDPTDDHKNYIALSAAELSMNMAKALNITPFAACTKNETKDCANRPIVTCDKKDSLIIRFEEHLRTEIDEDRNCLVIRGTGEEIVKATNKVLYLWYGIMKHEIK